MSTHRDQILTATRANVANPGSDPGGRKRAAVRLYLHTYAAGQCVTCGQATLLDAPSSDPRQATIGHLASVGDSKRGIRAGAIANQCRECQDRQGNTDVTPYLTDAMVARVPVAWPAWRVLLDQYDAARASATADTYRAAASAARAAAGLPF